MMTVNIVLLFALLTSHFLADFCFTSPAMIRAKADGGRPIPILLHACIHAGFVGLCLMVMAQASFVRLILLVLLELVSHFIIDMAKGRLSAHFKSIADNSRKPYWILYGFDQLLHQSVIIIIWRLSYPA